MDSLFKMRAKLDSSLLIAKVCAICNVVCCGVVCATTPSNNNNSNNDDHDDDNHRNQDT